MNSPYKTHGVWYQPRSKKELIDWIVKSGRWNDTKQKLKDMETKQLRGIYNSIMQQITLDIMRPPVHLSNGLASKDIPQTHTQTNEVQNE